MNTKHKKDCKIDYYQDIFYLLALNTNQVICRYGSKEEAEEAIERNEDIYGEAIEIVQAIERKYTI